MKAWGDRADAAFAGQPVQLGEHSGCLEGSGKVSSVRWSQDQIGFHLRGDVAPGKAVHLAQTVSLSYSEVY